MRRIGCGDDDQVNAAGEQLVDAADEFDVWIARVWCASALDDGGQTETRDRANDRRVEYSAREAETDESDVEHDRDGLYQKQGRCAVARRVRAGCTKLV